MTAEVTVDTKDEEVSSLLIDDKSVSLRPETNKPTDKSVRNLDWDVGPLGLAWRGD